MSEWPGSCEGQGLAGFLIVMELPTSEAPPVDPPGRRTPFEGQGARLLFTDGVARAVRGELPHFWIGVCLKLESLYELLYKTR